MQTLVLQAPGDFRLIDTPAPEPGSLSTGEALVRVRRVGICGTDIHAYGGHQPFFSYPRILGHELGVEVLAVGDGVTNVRPGDRCAVEPYLNCGDCVACNAGKTNCCTTLVCMGVHGDGGMRERVVVPAHKLHRCERLGYDALALVETLGIGKHAVSRSAVGKGESVAVLGLGPIGLTVVQFAQLAGAEVVGVDVSARRAAFAQKLLGVPTLQLDPDQPLAAQWEQRHGEPPLKVFDATGHRGSMQAAFSLPAHGGSLAFVGLLLGDITFDDPAFHRKELTLLASRNALGRDFTEIIAHMEAGRIDVASWITHRTTAAQLPGVFEDWLKPEAGLLKGVVSFDG